MVKILKGFNGLMAEDSVQATIYNYWSYFFHGTLFHEYTKNGKKEVTRLAKSKVDGKDKMIPFW